MEDLALLVSGIVIGLIVLGIAAVALALFSRKRKVSKYLVLGIAGVLGVVAIFAWQGSDRLAMIPLAAAVIASAIALWPSNNK